MSEPRGAAGGSGEASADRPRRHRLDPDRAAAAARTRARHPAPQVVDTRRYQRMIGFFGLLLVVMVSVSFLLSRGQATAGVPPGKPLPEFAAPLAASTLNGAANLHPHCALAQHDPRALNVCLLVKRAPLVLAFFVTGSSGCEQEVTALQSVSRQFPAGAVNFAAVAVRANHHEALQAVRAHGWTLQVAYDLDGSIGAAYGIEVCPIVELVRRGGIVAKRLIGEHWSSTRALAPEVQALISG